jgi:hypothetical protein
VPTMLSRKENVRTRSDMLTRSDRRCEILVARLD